ncbi:MAG: hypothetical protein QOJ03_2795, partial [Frankiaceae bacterium]|jgi:hypothetical protein|nr:hypothetical protein [Frankiaceae bacterium]
VALARGHVVQLPLLGQPKNHVCTDPPAGEQFRDRSGDLEQPSQKMLCIDFCVSTGQADARSSR